MMHIMYIVLLSLFLSCNNCYSEDIPMPKGWQIPTGEQFFQDWRKSNRNNFLKFDADLNCDGNIDTAMILESTTGNGIGIFVFMRDEANRLNPICVYNSMEDSKNIQDVKDEIKKLIQDRYKTAFGIRLAKKGWHITACGKGYYNCDKTEKEKIFLECGGVDFFHFDAGGNKYIYWDKQAGKFTSQSMSD